MSCRRWGWKSDRTKKKSTYCKVRKGRIMFDEKVEWKEKGIPSKLLDLYLLECQSFGSNSGSPVFLI
jgi:hypothetical protein